MAGTWIRKISIACRCGGRGIRRACARIRSLAIRKTASEVLSAQAGYRTACKEGQCVACGRFGGRHRVCPWCEGPVFHRHSFHTGRLAAVLLLGGCLLLPRVSRRDPLPKMYFEPDFAAARTGLANFRAAPENPAPPSLALPLPRGASSRPGPVLPHGRGQPGLTRHVLWLTALALAAAAFCAWLPVVHPFSLVFFGLMFWRGAGSAADWAFALACLLGAGLVSAGRVDWMAGGSRGNRKMADAGGSRRASGAPQWLSWGLATALIVAGAPLLIPLLRRLGLLFAPYRGLLALLLLVFLTLRAPSRPAERLPFAGWQGLWLRIDRLLLVIAAGALGWAGAWIAGDAGVRWSPHALTLALAGLYVLPAPAKRKASGRAVAPLDARQSPANNGLPVVDPAACGAFQRDETKSGGSFPPVVPLALAASANLLAPLATGEIGGTVLTGFGCSERSGHSVRLTAWIVLAGFLFAVFGGLGLPAGGGAWLADAAGIAASRKVAFLAVAGVALGMIAGCCVVRLTRGRRESADFDGGLFRGPARRLAPGPNACWVAALLLALGTQGFAGALFLGLAAGIGRLPARLAVEPALLGAYALLPLALGLPGVADPYPALRGWLP